MNHCGGGCDTPSPGGGRSGTFYPGHASMRRQIPSFSARSEHHHSHNRPPPRHDQSSSSRRPRIPPPPRDEIHSPTERPLPGRDDLANSIMDYEGGGEVWNESGAVSLSQLQEHSEEEEEDDDEDDEDICPPCEELDDVAPELYDQTPPDISHISHETPPRFHDISRSYRHISDETPPSFSQTPRDISHISHETPPSFHDTSRSYRHISHETPPSFSRTPHDISRISHETPPSFHDTSRSFRNISDETPPIFDGDGCPPCEAEHSMGPAHLDDPNVSVISLAEGPSNISVYDAEELNITTAPRNIDWDIPRNRIWQTLSSSLDETELQEEDDYMAFVADLQSQRRSFFSCSID